MFYELLILPTTCPTYIISSIVSLIKLLPIMGSSKYQLTNNFGQHPPLMRGS